MTGWKTRIRALVADNFAIVLVVLLALGAIGGGLAVTAQPTTTTEYRSVTLERGSGTFSHEATVVRGGAVFENGTTLENRSVYFTRVTPILNETFAYTYESKYQGTLDTTIETQLVLHAVDEEGNTEYWRRTRKLDVTRMNLTPGETLRTRYAVNVSAIDQRLRRIQQQLGSTPGKEEVLIVANVSVEGTIDGQQVRATRTYRQRIEPAGGVYRVRAIQTDAQGTTIEEPVRQTTDPTYRRYLGYLLGGVGGVSALGLLTFVGFRGGVEAIAPDETDRERLRYASERSEYDEWITVASLPPEIRDRPRIEIDSLEGLVDVAIDTDGRVLERPDESAYYVLGEKVLYVYTRPGVSRVLGPPRDANDREFAIQDDESADEPFDWREAVSDTGPGSIGTEGPEADETDEEGATDDGAGDGPTEDDSASTRTTADEGGNDSPETSEAPESSPEADPD